VEAARYAAQGETGCFFLPARRVFRMPPPLRTPAKRRFVPNAELFPTQICAKQICFHHRFVPNADLTPAPMEGEGREGKGREMNRRRSGRVVGRVTSAFPSHLCSRQICIFVKSAPGPNLRFCQYCIFVKTAFLSNLRFCQICVLVKSGFSSNLRACQI